MDAPLHFYNNCLISCVLIGSFLSSLRVRTDKILIYASFQRSAVKVSTCKPMGFYWLSYVTNQKARKAMNNGRVILNKIHLALFTLTFPSLVPGIWPFWGIVIVKTKLMAVFLCVCPLIEHKLRLLRNHSPAAHCHFDNVMTKFVINKRTDAQKSDVNLLNR